TSAVHSARALSAPEQRSVRSQRMSSARSSVLVTGGTLVEGIRGSKGKPCERPEMVVSLEQLTRVADVAPVTAGGVAVDGSPRDKPSDQPSGMVGRIALVEVAAEQRHVGVVVQVRRGRDESRGWL